MGKCGGQTHVIESARIPRCSCMDYLRETGQTSVRAGRETFLM